MKVDLIHGPADYYQVHDTPTLLFTHFRIIIARRKLRTRNYLPTHIIIADDDARADNYYKFIAL